MKNSIIPAQQKPCFHGAENTEAWHFPFSTDALEGPEATDTAILFVSDIKASLEEQRDGETIHWYQVTYPTKDGEHTGWVRSQGQAHISLHSQWGWPGFEVVNNTALTLDQYFARQMLAGNNVLEEEKTTFKAPAQAVEAGPIFERIYGIISKQMNTLLPPKDIPKTMRQPKVQQDLSRLIIKQPTEWQGSKPWTCLDQYMHNEAQPDWDATKEQIDKLAWWDEVNTQAKLNLGSTVMNVHPVALVSNYKTNIPMHVTIEQLATIMPNAKPEKLNKFLIPINITFELFQINTTLRKAHFLAQVAHETNDLRFLEELGSDSYLRQYDGRLGNRENTDDYKTFKGRGLLHITGRETYTSCQNYLNQINDYQSHGITNNLDFISNSENAKKLSSDPLLSSLASGYFWSIYKPKLNKSADTDDIFWVSVYVNGWTKQKNPYYPQRDREPNHMKERVQKLNLAKKSFGVI